MSLRHRSSVGCIMNIVWSRRRREVRSSIFAEDTLDSVTTVRRLVAFYVDEHNRVPPHSAFRGQTPDEMYFGIGDTVPADLTSGAATARRTRVEVNRSASCERCPSIDAAA